MSVWKEQEVAISTGLRFAVYTIFIVYLALALPWLLRNGSALSFGENQLIEWLEIGFLAGVSAVALWGGYCAPPARRIMFLLASLSILALFREMDMIMDALVPVIGWKIGYVILLWGAWRAYVHRAEFLRQLVKFLGWRSFALLWAGFILVMPFAQLIGYGNFLKQLLGGDYMRDYRRVIQETAELMGYVLFLAGAIEGVIQARQELNTERGES